MTSTTTKRHSYLSFLPPNASLSANKDYTSSRVHLATRPHRLLDMPFQASNIQSTAEGRAHLKVHSPQSIIHQLHMDLTPIFPSWVDGGGTPTCQADVPPRRGARGPFNLRETWPWRSARELGKWRFGVRRRGPSLGMYLLLRVHLRVARGWCKNKWLGNRTPSKCS